MNKRKTVPAVAIAAMLPVGFAAYAATTATASPSHVVARPGSTLIHAGSNGVFRPAYPPPPPPTTAPPTSPPPTTAPPTSPPPTTAPPTSPPPTATPTATPTKTPPPPVTTPPVVVNPGHNGKTHRGGHPHVKVHPHAFNPGGTITIVIHGPHGFTLIFTRTVGPRGGVNTHIHIPGHAPAGHYRIVIHGRHNGHKVLGSGDFRVKK